MGDSDEADEDDYNEQAQLSAGEESRSPTRTIHTNARMCRSEGGSSGEGKRLRHEQDFDYFVDFDDDDISRYLRVRGMGDDEDRVVDTLILYTLTRSSSQQRTASHSGLPRMIGEESGGTFIHRVLNGCQTDFCRQLLRLDQDAFIHLVNVIIEKRLIDEGRFIKTAEIVAISLYIFARGASYRDVEIQFRHSPSTIGNYHNQVLEALVKLYVDIVRPYQSQDEVPPEIAQKPGFYWPYFNVRC
ncbi:hypothetical protein Cgig2_027954 [Carnegiea gigantea]|uniref:DUF8040 domain-containing protein n=1 Tax=Carnegiea gigantea TaxID=171969 RepID=A0A9Q1GIJ4_9CARY|nr:hypothetical protein Cgig2_027954 [Carnegiea gigantea]